MITPEISILNPRLRWRAVTTLKLAAVAATLALCADFTLARGATNDAAAPDAAAVPAADAPAPPSSAPKGITMPS